MKILHIHPAMRSGGIESMICGLANEMSKHEDVTVCSIFQPNQDDIFWNKLAPSVHKTTLGKKEKGFSMKEIFKIYEFLKRERFDIVNMHGMFYYYAFSVLLLHNKIKFFYTVHSDAAKENTSWDAKLLPLKKLFFKVGFIHPITISEISQASFEKLYQCPSTLIYNGVPKSQFTNEDLTKKYRLTPETKIFLHAGRIDSSKNQLVLCRVFNRLIEEGEDVVLLIAGVNQDENIFQSIRPYFGERIHYLGERDDIPLLMSQCDGMCLPSIWEGMPIVLLEALSVGCVPICSPVGGIVNVIKDGYNGFLSSSSNEVDFYATMRNFISLNSDEINRIKRNCLTSFSKYSIENTAKKYLRSYNSL